jgi:uncharacterized protein YndB with AHSA1/START domain
VADYAFLTTWCVDAPIQEVFDLLCACDEYPRWWPAVRSVELLRAGDERRVGEVSRFAWRGPLPYTVRFDTRVTGVRSPHLIEAAVTGGLEGTGVWRLFEGRGTAVVYQWRVRTTPRWMHALDPIARSAFTWNHDRVMREGGRGLARRLDATLIAQS